jgi:hypothetical protein
MRWMFVVVALFFTVSQSEAQDFGRALEVMREVASACPRAYANAHADHNQHPERLDYIILAAQALKRVDARWGMNGKRGNAGDPSSDALAYGEGRNVRIYDVIASAGEHGTNLGALGFNDVTEVSRPNGGIYVDPDAHRPRVACGTAPAPTPGGPFPGGVWEAKHAELLQRFPHPSGPDAGWVREVAEQFAFTFPGEGWGHKAAGEGRPPSSDVMARQLPDGRLAGFRVVPPSAHPMQFDLSGQAFIAVAPVDHLGLGRPVDPPPVVEPPPAPTPQPPAPRPSPDHDELKARLDDVLRRLAAIEKALQSLPAMEDLFLEVASKLERLGKR